MSMNRESNFHEKRTCSYLFKVSNIDEQFEYTESDATFPLFCVDRLHLGELIQCLTCKTQFKSYSFSDICAHYTQFHNWENAGTVNIYNCLYCTGNVHFYLRSARTDPEIFHFCKPIEKTD
ncbi:uncharacterized protein [Drosophila bipectinata]|uniref:uncharacterized protein n=1 Tax=Drosophila bipectinata TaxID=42026 RepID=UPI001C88F2C8|nr:uncharacterized protein LOC122321378 [Drosophila bipectinata]